MNRDWGILLKNSFLAFVGKIIYQFGNAFLFFLIARLYGPEEAGIYTLAVRYTLLFLTLAVWGLDALLIWKVAANPSVTWQYLVNYSLLRLLLGAVAYLVLVLVVSNVTGYSAHTIRVILLLAWGLVPEGIARLIQCTFVAHQHFVYPTIVALIVGGLRCILGWALLWLQCSLELLAFIQACSSLVGLGMYALPFYSRRFKITLALFSEVGGAGENWQCQIDWDFMRRQISTAWPFMLMEMFLAAEGQVDTIVLSFYLQQNQVGFYSAAQSIVLPLAFALYAYHTALYPLITRLYERNQAHLWSFYRRLFLYTTIILLPIAIVLTVLAPAIVNLVYKSQFISSAIVVPWLTWSIVLQFLNEPNSRLSVVAGYQKVVTILLGLSALSNVLLNCVLVPNLGIWGSAWARLISTLFFTLSNGILVFGRITHINPLPIMGKPILAAFAWGGIFCLCQAVGSEAGLVLGGICYLLVLFLTRAISFQDLRRLWEAV